MKLLHLILLCLLGTIVQGQTIWAEDFTYTDGTTTGADNNLPAGPDWTATCPTCLTNDWLEVRSNQMQGRDTNGEAIWTSESIDISTCTNGITYRVDLSETGTMEGCTCGCTCVDWIRVEHRIDGGAWFQNSHPNGGPCTQNCAGSEYVTLGDFTAFTFESACLLGTTLELRIAVQCWAGTEFLNFDNIEVLCSPACNLLSNDLVDFTGKKDLNQVVLDWTTVTTTEVISYTVEHSIDGLSFNAREVFQANQTTEDFMTYQWVDEMPQNGINYYRLKMLFPNNQAAYSQIIAIEYANPTTEITLFPNPAQKSIHLRLNQPAQVSEIEVLNALGQPILRRKYHQEQKRSWDTTNWSSGVYSFGLKVNQVWVRKKIIIQH